MSFLYLNGILVPCAVDGGAKRKLEQQGANVRAVDFSLRINRRTMKRGPWSLRTPLLGTVEAEAIRGLVLGLGHNWSFDDATKGLYSGKGLGPSASTNSVLSTANPFQGARHIRQTATSGTITFTALPLNSPHWTVIVARDTGSGYKHYIVTDVSQAAGEAWEDGVYGSVATAWLTVTPSVGTVKLDAAGSTTDIDELVVLPYRIPHNSETETPWGFKIWEWIVDYSHQWGPLARLTMQGYATTPDGSADPLAGTAALTVAGEIEESEYMIARDPAIGVLPDFQSVGFTLKEI